MSWVVPHNSRASVSARSRANQQPGQSSVGSEMKRRIRPAGRSGRRQRCGSPRSRRPTRRRELVLNFYWRPVGERSRGVRPCRRCQGTARLGLDLDHAAELQSLFFPGDFHIGLTRYYLESEVSPQLFVFVSKRRDFLLEFGEPGLDCILVGSSRSGDEEDHHCHDSTHRGRRTRADLSGQGYRGDEPSNHLALVGLRLHRAGTGCPHRVGRHVGTSRDRAGRMLNGGMMYLTASGPLPGFSGEGP